VGAVGLIDDYARRADFASLNAGETLLLLGVSRGELGSSLYLRECLGREDGAPPPVDLAAERRNGDFVRALIGAGELRAVHDLSDGGLVAAAAEMALASDVGVSLDATSAAHAHAFLFGEDQARYLVATDRPERLIAKAHEAAVPVAVVGVAGGDTFNSGPLFSIPLARLREAHEGWMPAFMDQPV
jgi:phosphoribosylformylglycinamidine synthase